ncbi:MAG: metal ABC transporter ATP-binding protein [Alphaproteobacteria bacterium GM202ARS2]|nr:metal ABC transporter ATP-binding protein [Alphaproteobacteria bacterium GM202ARS2]
MSSQTTTTGVALLAAYNLKVMLQGKAIIDDVSLTVGERDFLTIIGPNGAGKTMLLKCLMGIVKPQQGDIRRSVGLRIGYMPQDTVIPDTMPLTSHDFLTLCRSGETSADALHALAAELAIEGYLHQPMRELSKGELQRVFLARALLSEPHVLLLDEPTQNLDISGQYAFYELLDKIYEKKNIGIVMVSHDLHLVMRKTRHVVCLFHHICCRGQPQAISQDPAFVSLFGKAADSLLAFYPHKHDHSHD